MFLMSDVNSLPARVASARTLICFSHLRWHFVTQRPQHLMARFAHYNDVIFWEEPILDAIEPRLDIETCKDTGIVIATPHLPQGERDADDSLRALLDGFLVTRRGPIVRWYYTPMMLPFSRHVEADCVVYDCMDELANFSFAPPQLLSLENELLAAADVVFTGGHSLYEAKRARHANVHPFPSSVDVAHFAQARSTLRVVRETPIVGFYGVIDERLDLTLVDQIAASRPDWRFEMVGPVVKIDPELLPRRANIHWQGPVDYAELPHILSAWDVAIMPFALNDSTRFISPTKTPEYLAAGRPVVSTPIIDVARHYGELAGVRIADGAAAFVGGIEDMIAVAQQDDWLDAVDVLLSQMSWDGTAKDMAALIVEARGERAALSHSKPREHFDVLVVGAGFAGAVMAERLAADAGLKVLVVDRRDHIAGNAYDVLNEAGMMIHQYGPHIFHTNSSEIVAYLSQFTEWRPYEHRVLASVSNKLVPIPINRTTLNTLYRARLENEEDAAAFLAARAEPVETVRTSEDVVVAAVGRELYETFFKGYTRKQWGLDPSQLDKSVTARVPTRTNDDDRYFTDTFQAMPREGYTEMFARMLDHPNITVRLGTDYRDLDSVSWDRMVYTGAIDEFFDNRFGKLPYRSLRFRHKTIDCEQFQPVATVNFPSEDVPYTRITEYKHLTGQDHTQTSITYEFPCAEGDPFYPIPRPENQARYRQYENLARQQDSVIFVGRLATYRYYNMDQVVGQALATYRRAFASTAVRLAELPAAVAA